MAGIIDWMQGFADDTAQKAVDKGETQLAIANEKEFLNQQLEAAKSGAYQLNPTNANYVQETAQSITGAGVQAVQKLENAASATEDFGYSGANAIQNIGTQAQQAIGGYGTQQGTNLQNLGQQASGAITKAATGGAGEIYDTAAAGQHALYDAANQGASAITGASQAGQSALTNFGTQQEGWLNQQGANALNQLDIYGTTHAGMLGQLGAGAAQSTAAQGQAATALALQQGAALGGMAAQAGGGVTQGALAQSGAINQFAAQQAAAAAAAQNRQFADPNFAAANALYGTAGASAADLAGLEAIEGPSAAQAQLQSGLNATQAQALAMARSGKGWGGSASALSQAAGEAAQAAQQASLGSAQLRAQENAAWRARQASNLGAAAGIQTALGEQAQGQSQFAGELALRQQALADQTALGYGGQSLGALTDAGNLAMQGGLGGGQLALQGGQAGADLALRGALGGGELGLSGAQLQGQLAGQGAELGLNALTSGQQLNLQAAQAGANAGMQGLQAGYDMGLQGAGMASDARLQGLTAGAGLGLQGATAAGDMGLQGAIQAGNLAAQTYGQGAEMGLGAMETGYGMNLGAQQAGADLGMAAAAQSGTLGSQAMQQYLDAIGMENQLYQQQMNAQRAAVSDSLTRYGIDKGVAIQQQQMDNQMLGAGLSAAGSMLPLLLAASDRDAKMDIKPASQIVVPGSGPSGDRGFVDTRGTGAMGPGGPAYDRAMDAAARAEKFEAAKNKQKWMDAASASGNMLQAGGSMLQAGPSNPFMLNPYAQQYLASDVNSKTEIQQLRGQVQAMGGTPPPSQALGQAAPTPSGNAYGLGTGGTGFQPASRTVPPAQPAPAFMTQTQPAQSPGMTMGQSRFGTQLDMQKAAPVGTAPPVAPTPAPSAQSMYSAQQPTATPGLTAATRASFAPSPGLQTQAQPAPTQSIGSSGPGLAPSIAKPKPAVGFVASDERSKMRIAQLEDQVSIMGGNPSDSTERMPLVFDPQDKIYRPYAPEAESTGGFVRGAGVDKIGASRQRAVDGLLSQGVFDPKQIEGYLNYDDSGNKIGDFTSGEIAARLTENPLRGAAAQPRFAGPRASSFADYSGLPSDADVRRMVVQGGDRVVGAPEIFNRYQTEPDIAALDEAYAREQSYDPLGALLPEQDAAARTIAKAPAYSFEYKNPERFGEGRYAGPMAQDLERTPEGRSVVKQGPDGTKMVDTSRLSLLNTAALHQMQERIGQLETSDGFEYAPGGKNEGGGYRLLSDADMQRAAQIRPPENGGYRPLPETEQLNAIKALRLPANSGWSTPTREEFERTAATLRAIRDLPPMEPYRGGAAMQTMELPSGQYNPFQFASPAYDQAALDEAYFRQATAPGLF